MNTNGILTPLALVGGNCSLLGYDKAGENAFWTVAGDNISALSAGYIKNKRDLNIIAGSEDYAIQIFQGEEMIYNIQESSKPIAFTPIKMGRFAYALDNGNCGIYKRTKRAWRIKTKHKVLALENFDMTGDGVPEMIIAWSNGRFEVRKQTSGEILFKKLLKAQIAGLVKADYRMDGT